MTNQHAFEGILLPWNDVMRVLSIAVGMVLTTCVALGMGAYYMLSSSDPQVVICLVMEACCGHRLN